MLKGTWKKMMTLMTASMGEWMLDMINNVSTEEPDSHGGDDKPVDDHDAGEGEFN